MREEGVTGCLRENCASTNLRIDESGEVITVAGIEIRRFANSSNSSVRQFVNPSIRQSVNSSIRQSNTCRLRRHRGFDARATASLGLDPNRAAHLLDALDRKST